MKKTHKVVMLPTEKASPLILERTRTNPKLIFNYNDTKSLREQYQFQSLYIISDDEIKKGDWIIAKQTDDSSFIHQVTQSSIDRIKVSDKKIVATTDSSLLVYLTDLAPKANYPLPQIPESFIQAYIKAYNEGKPITEVDLEIVIGQGQENGETTSIKEWIKTREDNTIIIHRAKTYTREEMEKAYREGFKDGLNKIHRAFEWIQDNL